MKQIELDTSKVKDFERIRQSGEKMLRSLNQEFQEKWDGSLGCEIGKIFAG